MLAFFYNILAIHAQEEYDAHRGQGSFVQILKYVLSTIGLLLVIALLGYLAYQHYMTSPEKINVEELFNQ